MSEEEKQIHLYMHSKNELGLATLCVEKDKEIERLNAIIDKLNEKGKFLIEVANEKQNRIDRAYTYNNYLREKCKFRLNDGHLRKMGKILIGEETELREIPRIGDDKK